MSDPEGNSVVFPRVPRDLTLSFFIFRDFHFNVLQQQQRIRLSGANQNSRLGTYKDTNLTLKTTAWMNDLQNTFLIICTFFLH